MKITQLFCDFNPNVKPHEATLTLTSREAGGELGLVTVDACEKHLGSLVIDMMRKHESITIVRHKKPSHVEKPIVDVVGKAEDADKTIMCPEKDCEYSGSLVGMRFHFKRTHKVSFGTDEALREYLEGMTPWIATT